MSCPLPSEQPVKRDEEGDKVTFHTPLGKKIFEAVTPKQRPLKNELFFPGRMYFRYELDEDFGSEIPTNVIRSKAEFSDFQVTFFSFVPSVFLLKNLSKPLFFLLPLLCIPEQNGRSFQRPCDWQDYPADCKHSARNQGERGDQEAQEED